MLGLQTEWLRERRFMLNFVLYAGISLTAFGTGAAVILFIYLNIPDAIRGLCARKERFLLTCHTVIVHTDERILEES